MVQDAWKRLSLLLICHPFSHGHPPWQAFNHGLLCPGQSDKLLLNKCRSMHPSKSKACLGVEPACLGPEAWGCLPAICVHGKCSQAAMAFYCLCTFLYRQGSRSALDNTLSGCFANRVDEAKMLLFIRCSRFFDVGNIHRWCWSWLLTL